MPCAEEALPACSSAEVTEVLGHLLPGMAITNPAQRMESADFGDVRQCNATVAGASNLSGHLVQQRQGPDHRYPGVMACPWEP